MAKRRRRKKGSGSRPGGSSRPGSPTITISISRSKTASGGGKKKSRGPIRVSISTKKDSPARTKAKLDRKAGSLDPGQVGDASGPAGGDAKSTNGKKEIQSPGDRRTARSQKATSSNGSDKKKPIFTLAIGEKNVAKANFKEGQRKGDASKMLQAVERLGNYESNSELAARLEQAIAVAQETGDFFMEEQALGKLFELGGMSRSELRQRTAEVEGSRIALEERSGEAGRSQTAASGDTRRVARSADAKKKAKKKKPVFTLAIGEKNIAKANFKEGQYNGNASKMLQAVEALSQYESRDQLASRVEQAIQIAQEKEAFFAEENANRKLFELGKISRRELNKRTDEIEGSRIENETSIRETNTSEKESRIPEYAPTDFSERQANSSAGTKKKTIRKTPIFTLAIGKKNIAKANFKEGQRLGRANQMLDAIEILAQYESKEALAARVEQVIQIAQEKEAFFTEENAIQKLYQLGKISREGRSRRIEEVERRWGAVGEESE